MSTISVNGLSVHGGSSITFPTFGAWSADLEVNSLALLPTGARALTVVVGDLTAKATVIRQAIFAGSLRARIVGGGAGWRKVVPARGYSHEAGVKLSSVLADAARECDELIAVATDRVVGLHYTREEAKAENVLELELDGQWWVDLNGITQTSARSSAAIVNPFTVVTRSGALGRCEIATDTIAPWQPGRTFTTLTVPDVQTISSVTIEATNEGKIRLIVLTSDVVPELGGASRLRADLRAIIRAELARLSYSGEWEYVIDSATSTTVDAIPTDDRMPPLTKCPMRPGLMGESVTPAAGSKCRIVFVNQDPARPECVGIIGNPTLATVGASPEKLARGPASEDVRAAVSTWLTAFASGVSGAADFSAFKTAMPAPAANAIASLTAAAPSLQTSVLKGT